MGGSQVAAKLKLGTSSPLGLGCTRARTFFFPIPLSLEKLSTSFGAENIATTNKLQDVFAAVGSSAAQINFPHVRVG